MCRADRLYSCVEGRTHERPLLAVCLSFCDWLRCSWSLCGEGGQTEMAKTSKHPRLVNIPFHMSQTVTNEETSATLRYSSKNINMGYSLFFWMDLPFLSASCSFPALCLTLSPACRQLAHCSGCHLQQMHCPVGNRRREMFGGAASWKC